MTVVVKYDNIGLCSEWRKPEKHDLSRGSRQRSKNCEVFPEDARLVFLAALTIAADGGCADIAKPMHGLGSGVFEIAHAFQKKSTQGIKTPKREIDLIKDRLKRLKEALR